MLTHELVFQQTLPNDGTSVYFNRLYRIFALELISIGFNKTLEQLELVSLIYNAVFSLNSHIFYRIQGV